MDPSAALKRFYKTVAFEESDDGYFVTLDGHQLKSPAKRPMPLPSQDIAKALVQEWDTQDELINPSTMPVMALVSTAVDRIGQQRNGVVEQIAKYGETDLVCYWASDPEELAIRQAKAWTPLIEWTKDRFDIPLKTQTGIMHLPQPEGTFDAFQRIIDQYNDWELAALSSATHCTGSIVIALALMNKHLDAQAAFEVSQIDETYQIELWGEDWEAKDRRETILRDLNNVTRFLNYL